MFTVNIIDWLFVPFWFFPNPHNSLYSLSLNKSKGMFSSIGMFKLLPPSLLLRSVEPPSIYKQEVISKKKNGKEEKNIHMFTNNSMICQMEDRGSHHEPAYHDHKEVVKWHSHYGHHTRDMIQWMHQKNKVLGTGALITSRLAHVSLPPSEWQCVHLVTKPAHWSLL